MIRLFLTLTIALCAALPTIAADTVAIRETQIPILLDRKDNVLFYLRIDNRNGANRTFGGIELQLNGSLKPNDIKALKLYYGGIEAPQRTRPDLFAPVDYISRNTPGRTREANPSYSIKLTEQQTPGSTVKLACNKPLYPGVNYFWISVEMNPNASLLTTFTARVQSVLINDKPATINAHSPVGIVHRTGIGVRHAGDDGSAAYRIPGLVTTNKGSLIGVYDVRYNSSVDLQEHIDIGVSRSIDGGQTWQPMQLAMHFGEHNGMPRAQNGVGDPAILIDRVTGRIWIIAAWTQGMGNGRAWTNSQPGMQPHETAQLMLVHSDDDGLTWSEPVNITSQLKIPEWHFLLQGPGMGIMTHDGTLVFAAQYIAANREPSACMIYSKDRGNTWKLHQPARSNTTEAQVAEIRPGVLMLNMRDNRGGSRAVSITTDWGKTWTEHPSSRKVLRESICMASLINVPAKENALGRDILLFSNPDTIKGRNHITIKASLDGGLTFPTSYQLMLDEDESWGYSCLTMINRETIGILYEGSTAHMVFQAIPLKDIVK